MKGQDVVTACTAIADARHFLASCGLETSTAVEVHIVDALPAAASGAFGCNVKAERRVYMLPLAACRQRGSALPVDEAVYRGLIAHEVGHHIASVNFRVPAPTVVAHEYIAYVTMFAAMPPEARARILALFPGDGFQSEKEIGLTLYLLDPNWFGAQSYRHFMRPGNGCAFIERVRTGRALKVEEP